MSRRVLFAEVPCFYATVEIAQDPALAGRPVIVGGDPRKRGLVQSASREALAAGVELEMPVIEALRLCPTARTVRTDVRLYRERSRRLVASLRREVDRLEPFGLGAAFVELAPGADADELAARLRARVATDLGLPLRIGVASGKSLARLAAEESGERGVLAIPADGEAAFLGPLPATRLEEAFGAHGLRIHALASARDDAPVRGVRHAQSLTREVTVRGESRDAAVLAEHVADLARELAGELARQALAAAQVVLRIRYADEGTQTRSQALGAPTGLAAEIQSVAGRLLERTQVGQRAVRTLGVQLARLSPAGESDRQLDLFPRGS